MRNDPDRLQQLRQTLALESSREQVYDDITQLLATGLDVPITIVNLLDEDRDWFKSSVGLAQTESPVATSFCEAFFNTDADIIVAEDTATDPRFAAHPLVVNAPSIRFYAAARLVVGGQTLGTLCAYDVQPHQVSAAQVDQLRSLASAAMQLLKRAPV